MAKRNSFFTLIAHQEPITGKTSRQEQKLLQQDKNKKASPLTFTLK